MGNPTGKPLLGDLPPEGSGLDFSDLGRVAAAQYVAKYQHDQMIERMEVGISLIFIVIALIVARLLWGRRARMANGALAVAAGGLVQAEGVATRATTRWRQALAEARQKRPRP